MGLNGDILGIDLNKTLVSITTLIFSNKESLNDQKPIP